MPLPRLRRLLLAALAATFALGAVPARAATTLPAGFEEHQLGTDFSAPGEDMIVDVAWAPDGRMFVADRSGMVFVHNPGAPADQHPLLLDIRDHVNNGPQTDRGLLGIAVDKDFATNGYLYLLYTYDKDTTDDNGWQVSTLRRVTVHPDNSVDGGATDPTETTILGQIPSTYGNDATIGVCGAPANDNDCIPSEGASHSIGTVRVAPDGTLFVGTGDGNDYTIVDPLTFYDNNPQTYRGKIMHIDRDGNGLTGHPFCAGDTDLSHVCTKIYAEGLRNPFRFTLRPGGGLAIGDVGEDAWEEFDLAGGGEDFGWPCWEGNGHSMFNDGTNEYDTTSYCQGRYADSSDNPTPPAVTWSHVPYPIQQSDCAMDAPRGNTAIGGPTYTGDQYPAEYRGSIFFGDWTCQWVYRAVMSGNTVTSIQPFASGWDGGVDLETAPDGNLAWIVDNEVREVVYNGPPAVSPNSTPPGGGGTSNPHARLARLRFSAGAAKLSSHGVLSGKFSSPSAVKALQVSLWRGHPFANSCRWWSKKAHALKRGSCKSAHWMKASLRHKGARYTWKLSLGRKLGKGSYTLVLQALPRSASLAPSAQVRKSLRVR